jgi:outer membrane protein TolC
MAVKRVQHSQPGRVTLAAVPVRALAASALLVASHLAAPLLHAQSSNPSSAANPYYGSVTAHPATEDTLNLSLDEAIAMGLRNNLGLKEAESGEKILKGEKNEALQQFLPTITVTGATGVYQHNLAALGFSPGVIGDFGSIFPGGKIPKVSEITKDTLTEGRIHLTQTLFSGPVIAGYKAAGAAEKSAYFSKMSARGEVVQQVASAYLHAIAAASEVDNAKAQQDADQVAFNQAHAAHEAGTAANLDELRAHVQLQTQQQALIVAQSNAEKDLILLKREIGVAPGQKIVLTDPAPYSDLADETPAEVRALAYRSRQDYQNLQNQAVESKAIHASYRSQRLPTLSLSGYYAVSDVTGVDTHGNFMAQGTLSVPLFQEAKLRGDNEAAAAQMDSLNRQLADLRDHIDQQVRSALLDVSAAEELVKVSRSNVDLATRALSDETARVNAGVDDNLPLVDAQATLASAQTNLVQSLYQFNVAKLALARAAGVLETQYRAYLGK